MQDPPREIVYVTHALDGGTFSSVRFFKNRSKIRIMEYKYKIVTIEKEKALEVLNAYGKIGWRLVQVSKDDDGKLELFLENSEKSVFG